MKTVMPAIVALILATLVFNAHADTASAVDKNRKAKELVRSAQKAFEEAKVEYQTKQADYKVGKLTAKQLEDYKKRAEKAEENLKRALESQKMVQKDAREDKKISR
jgi:hypothetical protein